ncbi:MAG TPA: ABC transporter permease [Candidatus Krumholzibacteria bacterium]|nr:ABC transporter permease [Candidatus Krumholzibacteria bacterium]
MQFDECVKVAIATLRAHKMRGLLTCLGVIIGVTAVIGLLAIVSGIRDSVSRQFSSIGAEMISINRWDWASNGDDEDYEKRKPLTMREFEAVRNLPSVSAAAPTVYTSRDIVFRNVRVGGVTICGTNDVYPAIENWKVQDGRFLAEDDVHATRAVVVLGADVAQNIFPDGGAVDQDIRIGGQAYRVIGTLEKKGSIFGQSQDNIVNVPYTSFAKHWGMSTRRDVNISALSSTGHSMQETIDEIRGALRRVRRVPLDANDDFAINTSDRLIQTFNRISAGFFAVMIMIGGMALLVGGIGIMNIMLVSVTERTREIGIRKAIGARRRDIVVQFLIEAVILCLLGGVVGILLGCGIALAVAQASPVPARVTTASIVLGFGVSTIVGLVFGMWPAIRASRLDPVDALRYE